MASSDDDDDKQRHGRGVFRLLDRRPSLTLRNLVLVTFGEAEQDAAGDEYMIWMNEHVQHPLTLVRVDQLYDLLSGQYVGAPIRRTYTVLDIEDVLDTARANQVWVIFVPDVDSTDTTVVQSVDRVANLYSKHPHGSLRFSKPLRFKDDVRIVYITRPAQTDQGRGFDRSVLEGAQQFKYALAKGDFEIDDDRSSSTSRTTSATATSVDVPRKNVDGEISVGFLPDNSAYGTVVGYFVKVPPDQLPSGVETTYQGIDTLNMRVVAYIQNGPASWMLDKFYLPSTTPQQFKDRVMSVINQEIERLNKILHLKTRLAAASSSLPM